MSMHKLTAGDGYTYLTRSVAAHDATSRGYDSLGEYYSEKGEAPGVWMGRGLSSVPEFPVGEHVTEAQMAALFGEGRHPNADDIERALRATGGGDWAIDQGSRLGSPYRIYEQANMFHRRSAGAYRDHNTAQGLPEATPVPEEDRSRIRTELATTMFAEAYGRDPGDARELSGHLARISRPATTAVAGYDLTFSPVKSVSTLWAIAPREMARQIEQAHHDAVKDTLTWLEDNASYTRRGRNGVAQVDVRGLIAAAFTHRDSRAGDPDLHTHVAVSNKVQTLDGQWLALDGRVLYKNNVTASERYNTRLEALLIDRLGVSFAERPGTDPGKRAIREITGIDGELPRKWSSRRADIDVRRAALSAEFQAQHHRPPTPKEAIELAQQATLKTRDPKHAPRSIAEQRDTWRAEALTVLGGETGLRDYVRGAVTSRSGRSQAQKVTGRWVKQSAAEVLDTVQSSRAVWQENHVRAEAERRARTDGVGLGDVDRAVEAIVARALSPQLSLPLDSSDPITEPDALRRADGASVYTVAGSKLYTSTEIVAAEQAIVAAAGRRDGRVIPMVAVDLALLESTANGVELNPGQVQLVRELATSGARVQLALAPAGTGKTTAMRVLSRSWTEDGGTVIGLAPSAAAAAVLSEEIGTGTDTDTLAKLIWHITSGARGPEWIARIGPDTLVVIDEAGMAGTTDLAKAIDYITGSGGSVRLIGDDQQLAAIGAGGVLRDLAEVHGAVTLSQVMRFTDPETGAPNHAEGAASLALREGDPAALAYYIDHHRIHVGDQSTVTDDAFTAWSADQTAGRDAIMLAPTRDLVAVLNDRARSARLAQDGLLGKEISLSDGSQASAGDTIITRQNKRRIPIGATDWVKNGDRWTVEAVRESGALDVIHLRTGRHITLPADYTATQVSLGYACTVHGAQGITADTSYTVATGDESRQLLYVAMTRGRHANHVYLQTSGDGDPHSIITSDALRPPTAVDILTRVLARDGAPTSATSQTRAIADPATQLPPAADRYYDALTTGAQAFLGPDKMAAIDTVAATILPGIPAEPAWPTLRAHLALLAVDGADPATALRAALNSRDLTGAHDIAAVLDWRLNPTGLRSGSAGPLPWLPALPPVLADDPGWGDYLKERDERVSELATLVADRARAWTPTSAPTWATSLIDRNPQLVAELAVWRAANNVEDTDRRHTGAARPGAADARTQRALDAQVTRVLGDPKATTTRWASLANSIDNRITADPYWPTLADRLTSAERAGIDIISLTQSAGAEAPLPDEQPAAALWWRLSKHLSPAAMTATDHSAAATLRPDWTPVLAETLGTAAAERVLADPAWPALVAAVTHARRDGWEPGQLLSTASDLLRSGQPDDQPLRPEELATALVWRIGLLADPAARVIDDHRPLSDETTINAAELDLLAVSDSPADEDWLATLTEPGQPAEQAPDDTDHETWLPPAEHDAESEHTPALFSHPAPRQPYLPDADAAADAALEDAHRWDTALVSRARILELNQQAADFYTARYPDSWAPTYLTARLGTDLTNDDRFTIGYAPDSWTALTDHLRRNGATDEEMTGAGLGSYASTGRVIDRFRDRLVFAIKDGQEIHGWIGRRNPAKTDTDNAGPKYLNTATTDLFIKSNEMYGLSEGAAELTAGATPVLVEGPMDAIAITLAGDGHYVGVAPLGTAFSDAQADKLTPFIGDGKLGVIVATDPDLAGQKAAHRAFWQLTARGDDPGHLVLPGGKDPADMLETDGAPALHTALALSGALADTLIDARAALDDRLGTTEGRALATRRAAQVIGALPPASWAEHLNDLVARIDIAPDSAMQEVITAGNAWTENPKSLAKRYMADPIPAHQTAPAMQPPTPTTQPEPGQSPAVPVAQRWAALADSINPKLTSDPGWRALAGSIDRAAAAGYDVNSALPALAAHNPLPDDHLARNLEYRLINACQDAMSPASPQSSKTSRDEAETAARTRMIAADRIAANRRTPLAPASPLSNAPTPPPSMKYSLEPGQRRSGPAR